MAYKQFKMREEPEAPIRKYVTKTKSISGLGFSISKVIEYCKENEIDIETAKIEAVNNWNAPVIKWKQLESQSEFQKRINDFKIKHSRWEEWCKKNEVEVKAWVENQEKQKEKHLLAQQRLLEKQQKELEEKLSKVKKPLSL